MLYQYKPGWSQCLAVAATTNVYWVLVVSFVVLIVVSLGVVISGAVSGTNMLGISGGGGLGITGAIYGVFTFCLELIFCLIGRFTGAFDGRVALP